MHLSDQFISFVNAKVRMQEDATGQAEANAAEDHPDSTPRMRRRQMLLRVHRFVFVDTIETTEGNKYGRPTKNRVKLYVVQKKKRIAWGSEKRFRSRNTN